MKPIRKLPVLSLLAAAALFLMVFLLLHLLYKMDNKYTAGPPYGKNGVLSCTPEDLSRPLFLIDGWEFYPDSVYGPEDFIQGKVPAPSYTFVGQYSNFSYVGPGHSPFGSATYRLKIVLEHPGDAIPVSLEIPEIFTEYTLYLNGIPAAANGSPSQADIILDGSLEVILCVENYTHYYSGLYYPPALGTPAAVSRILTGRTFFYSVLCISTLTLLLFSAILWVMRKKDSLFFHFALLCFCFCVSCLHPFFRLAGLNGRFWYAVEDAGRLAMLAESLRIASLVTGFPGYPVLRRIGKYLLPSIPVFCFLSVCVLIPVFSGFIGFYGIFMDAFTVLCWFFLCLCAAAGIRNALSGSWFLLSGCCCMGAGFLSNLLNNNRFEPIYTGWQTEYTGFLMVLIFGGLMVRKNADILESNRQLMMRMEELVEERTGELHAVLEERKNFFSEMAHNLKAPIAAVHGFISLIREGNLYLDEELTGYITMIESENEEIHKRVQSLNVLNAYDRICTPWEVLPVNKLLAGIYDDNAPDAGVMGIHLYVEYLEEEKACIYGQKEKLLTLFENLIYNAISFTPEGGKITITPFLRKPSADSVPEGKPQVVIQVADTGCGIPAEHLPHIFERFYVGRKNPSEGSGLGLYIARIAAEEMGGGITAWSREGEGSTFEISLPLKESNTPRE